LASCEGLLTCKTWEQAFAEDWRKKGVATGLEVRIEIMMMIVSVRVSPAAKREKVEELASGRLAIAVKEKPERNMANARVRELVAAHFGVEPKAVRLLNGHRSKSKVFEVKESGI